MTWVIILAIVVIISLVFYHIKSIRDRDIVIDNYAKKIAQLEFDLTNTRTEKKTPTPVRRTSKSARRKRM